MARTSSSGRRRDPNPSPHNSSPPLPLAPPSTASEQSVETEWKEIACHTAKCDMCNTRSGTGMSRCEGCSWQACYRCILANGCSRTHRGNGRTHTGDIDQTLIARMRRGRASVKKEENDATQLRRRQSRKLKKTANEESESASASDSSSTVSSSADDEVLTGARNLLALSIEAIGLAIREEASSGVAASDEDVANFMSMTSQELHDYAQQQASHALQAYLERRAREADAQEIGTFSIDEDTASSDKTQRTGRKRAGGYDS